MADLTTEQQNAVERENIRTRIRDRARIFREVFGERAKPTPHGAIILEALLAKFGHSLPPNVLDNNGRTDEYQTWRRLGHFDVMEYIFTQLDYKEIEHEHTSRGGT